MATAPKNNATPAADNESVDVDELKGTTILFSKSDIADMMGTTTQSLANRMKREKDFPRPTYSNSGGTMVLYSAEDVKRVHEHMTKADRERTARLAAALGNLDKKA